MRKSEVDEIKFFCRVCGTETEIIQGSSVGKCNDCMSTEESVKVMNDVFDFVENIFDRNRDPVTNQQEDE